MEQYSTVMASVGIPVAIVGLCASVISSAISGSESSTILKNSVVPVLYFTGESELTFFGESEILRSTIMIGDKNENSK